MAGHISRCDRCAWIVTEAMEADVQAETVDMAPAPRHWWLRLIDRVRSVFYAALLG
jgi:hypothetical protein